MRESVVKSEFQKDAEKMFKQEKRFYLGRLAERGLIARVLSPAPASEKGIIDGLLKEQRDIQQQSCKQNCLGLYRNASLVLASTLITAGSFSEAIPYVLDVLFLDMNGATNSLPGHESYDRQFSELYSFVPSMLKGCMEKAMLGPDEVEISFKNQWGKFGGFGKPPFTSDILWKRLQKEIA